MRALFLILLLVIGTRATHASPPGTGHDLVDVPGVISDAVLDIRYATSNNFLGRKVYPVARCFLRAPVAGRLANAAEQLRRQGYRLRIYDCYRPQSVQWKMWKVLPKPGYVADPRKGSHHSRGIAVDVSLADEAGNEVEMPTPYDTFGPRSRAYAQEGVSAEAKAHRRILQEAMGKAGFKLNRAEWWHFRAIGLGRSPLLDIPLEALP